MLASVDNMEVTVSPSALECTADVAVATAAAGAATTAACRLQADRGGCSAVRCGGAASREQQQTYSPYYFFIELRLCSSCRAAVRRAESAEYKTAELCTLGFLLENGQK